MTGASDVGLCISSVLKKISVKFRFCGKKNGNQILSSSVRTNHIVPSQEIPALRQNYKS